MVFIFLMAREVEYLFTCLFFLCVSLFWIICFYFPIRFHGDYNKKWPLKSHLFEYLVPGLWCFLRLFVELMSGGVFLVEKKCSFWVDFENLYSCPDYTPFFVPCLQFEVRFQSFLFLLPCIPPLPPWYILSFLDKYARIYYFFLKLLLVYYWYICFIKTVDK